jgi:hypothetical protein
MKFKEAQMLTCELWDWLATTGSNLKSDWPGWKSNAMPRRCCFACDYANNDCNKCPIDWPDGNTCTFSDSIYVKWLDGDFESRKEYAAVIRDLPWRRK